MRKNRTRLTGIVAGFAALGIAAAGCAADPAETRDNDSTVFRFAAAGDPKSLDPSLASDGETFRVTRQVFETLLDHERGGSTIVGGLAETWSTSEDGTQWSFTLREGVKFHNGEDLTAEVVCLNYDRWFNWSGNYQSAAMSAYWQDTFGGFAENESKDAPEPNYVGCSASDDLNLTIEVKNPSSRLPGGFTLASMAIHSPESIKTYDEQAPEGDDAAALTYPEYSQTVGAAHGTGPYMYKEWDKANHTVTVERFDDYWGEKAKIKTVVFKTIPKENDRKQELLSGGIDGYDLVAPQDIAELEKAGVQVPTRDPFNLLYLGFNQTMDGKDTPLADKKVREAIAHAINKDKIISQVYPAGTTPAKEFMPPTLSGWSDEVTEYEYNVDTAKEMLADAGAEDLTLDFCYPTDVTRPYMPSPESIFENMKADLQEIGITVEDKPLTWAPDFLDTTAEGGCSLYILGWTGDYNEAYNFLGTWFAANDPAWGFNDKDIRDKLAEADAEPDPEARLPLYIEANNLIMDFIPGVPIAHSSPSIAFAEHINPPTTSPLTQEDFAEASFK
ncbi:ABC transporter substrate-binding protein [Stackebrandtia soli]|uniref:ABC transporter substrate-binding protein n=1 Tax=Stackebrandtia soli TaxID=1892856 RepID=UPI0039EB6C3B